MGKRPTLQTSSGDLAHHSPGRPVSNAGGRRASRTLTKSSFPRRRSGILLHVTSLPGPYGIGELGPTAERWLRQLADLNQHCWQILPLQPPDSFHSPYRSTSAMANNCLLISLEDLRAQGLLRREELADFPTTLPDLVDFERIIGPRRNLLRRAAQRFLAAGSDPNFEGFCRREAGWLEDFVDFEVLTDRFNGRSWTEWPPEFRSRDQRTMEIFVEQFAEELQIRRIEQYFFDQQWRRVRRLADELAIEIIGDLPMFVSHNSADVWAKPELFDLRDDGLPRVVAGVPPDYFSRTGQRWGNPLYRWEFHRRSNFVWWLERFRRALQHYHAFRIDHFRGLVACWEIPADEETAAAGRWVESPGQDLLTRAERILGPLPCIAEDLGVITPAVEALRDRFGFPGVRPLLFAFTEDNGGSPFLPVNLNPNSVAYTGTHDNGTLMEFFRLASPTVVGEIDFLLKNALVRRHVPRALKIFPFHWRFLAWLAMSPADRVIFPLQDILGLGSEGRMNRPGTVVGRNWRWRWTGKSLPDKLAGFLVRIGERPRRLRAFTHDPF